MIKRHPVLPGCFRIANHCALSTASVLLCAALVPSAQAQDALGAGDSLDSGLRQSMSGATLRRTGSSDLNYGNVLDGNLRIGPNGQRDGRNMPSFRPDFQVGNLMVTGALAGDRNFRGDPGYRIFGESAVGYLAPSDFRGELGGDDIFNELQGSAFSQIQYVNSPLANDRYASAAGMGLYEYRRDFTPAEQIYNTIEAGSINQDRIRLDRTNAYTSSSNLYDTAVTPSSLFLMREASADADQDVLLSVESNAIQGIYTRKLNPTIPESGLGLHQRAAIYSGLRDGSIDLEVFGLPYQSATASVAAEDALNGLGREALVNDTRIDARVNAVSRIGDAQADLDAYEQIVRRLVEQYADNPNVNIDADQGVLEKVREEMDLLRELTTGVYDPSDAEGNPLTTRSVLSEKEEFEAELEAVTSALDDSDSEADENESEEELQERIAEAERRAFLARSAEIIRNGGNIDSFIEGQQGRIADLMKRGEDLLARGAFFDAETRFNHVLDINPGNPLALLGRANAQLGAGLFLSSALSLRKLFGNYPEITGTRLSERLLPNRTRLLFSRTKILERIDRGRDLPSYGLCLAYVGWLLKEPATVDQGLKLMETSTEDRSLGFFLNEVWNGQDESSQPLDSK